MDNIKKYGLGISLTRAKKLVKFAEKKAMDIQVPMVISVLDSGGNHVLLHRMDHALLGSIEVAINKAFTAVTVKVATHELYDAVQPGEVLYGLQNTYNDRLVCFGGGYPLVIKKEGIVGAIGVSGGSVEEDMIVAEFAVKKFLESLS